MDPMQRRSENMTTFPFSAIVGQQKMRLALILNAIDPSIGGVLICGRRGTGKSTAVRALTSLLPPIIGIADCPYFCDPAAPQWMCGGCQARHEHKETFPKAQHPVHLVTLPLNASEDRVAGCCRAWGQSCRTGQYLDGSPGPLCVDRHDESGGGSITSSTA